MNYVTTSAMDGEERGVVSLVFKMADVQFKKKPSSDSYVEVCSKMSRIGSDLPWRYDVFHTFLEGDEQTDLNRVDRDLSLMSAEVMARSKAHYGTCPRPRPAFTLLEFLSYISVVAFTLQQEPMTTGWNRSRLMESRVILFHSKQTKLSRQRVTLRASR